MKKTWSPDVDTSGVVCSVARAEKDKMNSMGSFSEKQWNASCS